MLDSDMVKLVQYKLGTVVSWSLQTFLQSRLRPGAVTGASN